MATNRNQKSICKQSVSQSINQSINQLSIIHNGLTLTGGSLSAREEDRGQYKFETTTDNRPIATHRTLFVGGLIDMMCLSVQKIRSWFNPRSNGTVPYHTYIHSLPYGNGTNAWTGWRMAHSSRSQQEEEEEDTSRLAHDHSSRQGSVRPFVRSFVGPCYGHAYTLYLTTRQRPTNSNRNQKSRRMDVLAYRL